MKILPLLCGVLLLARWLVEIWLLRLNLRHLQAHAARVPEAFASFIDPATYDRGVRYSGDRLRFEQVELTIQTVLTAVVLFSGLLPWLYGHGTALLGEGLWGQAGTLVGLIVLLGFLSLPLDWYEQFRLEARHGFNRSRASLWVADRLKDTALAVVLYLPLAAALLWLVDRLAAWWLWGFLLVALVVLLLNVLYPKLILPLYNKLQPLPEGELREALLDLAQRTGFRARTIEVIDGSKRSGHSNAFFTGFGRFRRIVLYDTLLQQLSRSELEAVLAHEIGHYRLGHVPRLLAVSAAASFVGFWLLDLLLDAPWFAPAFGFPVESTQAAPAFLLFSLLSGLLTFWLGPLFNAWLRHNEYAADDFARRALQHASPLIAALRKLNRENLSNLTPHPWYSGFHYSHPTLLEREAALRQAEGAGSV